METDAVKNLIKVWYEKASHEQDPFSKFIFLWFCFNAWLSHCSGEDTDAEMLRRLIGRDTRMSDLTTAYDSLMQASPVVFRVHIQNLVLVSPILDVRGIRSAVVIRDEEDFANISLGIYRIRCNLFHGGKNANDSRDQKLVVIAANILGKWVGSLKDQWR